MKNILKHFRIPVGNYALEKVSHGLINDTYAVSEEGEVKFILQRINDSVFTNAGALTHNIELLHPLLKGSGYRSFRLFPDIHGNYFPGIDGNLWRLMEFVPDSMVYQTTSDPDIAYQTGRILGIFHELLGEFDTNMLQVTLPRFHDVKFRMEQFKSALEDASSSRMQAAAGEIDFVNRFGQKFTSVSMEDLPIRVCHNDTKLNNVLCSKQGQALCLIDLDTLMPGSILFDLGDAIRTIANPVREDETDMQRIRFDRRMFRAFVQGLGSVPLVLSDEEKGLIPWSAAYMPFLHGLRALTDFLENDRYYKVSHPLQNLDRSRSLLKFARLALDEGPALEKIVMEEMPG